MYEKDGRKKGGKSIQVLGTGRTDKKHGYFRVLLKTWKAEVQVQV